MAATPQQLAEGRRKAALCKIADPLWIALADPNRKQEAARLMRELRELCDRDEERRDFDLKRALDEEIKAAIIWFC